MSKFDSTVRRGPFGPGFFGVGAAASTNPTIHSTSRSVSVTPTAIAGDIRNVDQPGLRDRRLAMRSSPRLAVVVRYSGLAFVGTGPGKAPIAMDMAARILVSASHQDGWAWDSFEVDDDTCFRFFVSFGSARVYELRVGVVG